MSTIPGTVVGAVLVPTDTADTYPVTDPQYGKGGLRTIDTTSARNAIPAPRLEEGMEVYVIATATTYRLKASYSTPTVDGDWETVGTGGGSNWVPLGLTTAPLVGGIATGTDLGTTSTSIQTTLRQILYPYRGPAVTLSADPAGGVREIGTSISSVDLEAVTVDWTDPITTVAFYRGASLINSVTSPSPTGGTETYTDSTAVSTATTYTARVGDGTSVTTSNAVTFTFLPGIYHGVDTSVITTGSGIITSIGASLVLGSSRLVNYTFDASVSGGANYIYICYPTSFGAPSSTRFNGFAYTDYTSTTVSLTNASGYTQNYYILRTNNSFSGASLSWEIL